MFFAGNRALLRNTKIIHFFTKGYLMKKNLIFMGILVVLIFSLTIFTGCAKKKSLVTSTSPAQEQEGMRQQGLDQADETIYKDKSSDIMEARDEAPAISGKAAILQDAIRDINFDYDSSTILPEAREILKANADLLLKNRFSVIAVEGHCDERGTAEYNMALGQRRAQETKQYLINLGIKESKISAISYGEERPLDAASSEEAWAKNRRAHFVVTP
jgi:peptidoglycan-associated lipoprotein